MKINKRWMAFSILFSIILLVWLILYLTIYSWGFTCTMKEKAAFSEFPHYGNIPLQPKNNGGNCWASFTTPDSPDQVIEYYRQQLTAHGWKEAVGNGLFMTRNGFSYSVDIEKFEGEDTYVAINVFQPA